MVQPFSPKLNISFDHAPLPSVQKNDKGVVINCSLTLPETIFAFFVSLNIEANLQAGATLLFLGSKNLTVFQEKFTNFTVERFKTSNYSTEQLAIIPIITSLWQKSRMFIANELTLTKNTEANADEQHQLGQLSENEAELVSQGYVGKMFTKRQSIFLLRTLGALANK